MKRIISAALLLIMAITALAGCASSQSPSESSSGERMPIALTIAETLPSCVAFEHNGDGPYCFYAYDFDGKLYRVLWTDFTGLHEQDVVTVDYSDEIRTLSYDEYPSGWTPWYEVTATDVQPAEMASCISQEGCEYVLTLPDSKQTFLLTTDQRRFVPYITDERVTSAERTITQLVSPYSSRSGIYLQITKDYLCLTVEVIEHLDDPYADGGCDDHEHLFFREEISTQAVPKREGQVSIEHENDRMIQFFPHAILEGRTDEWDVTRFHCSRLTDSDMALLRQVYNHAKGWTNDSCVDRLAFYFDGRVWYADADGAGWMYFGLMQGHGILYYNGYFKGMSVKVREMLRQYR